MTVFVTADFLINFSRQNSKRRQKPNYRFCPLLILTLLFRTKKRVPTVLVF